MLLWVKACGGWSREIGLCFLLVTVTGKRMLYDDDL